jgi:cytoskeletal protein RodZ
VAKRENISEQIRRYLEGELDARAMHQLEKEAQNDPFLMEALEGYEKVPRDQQHNLKDIQSHLKERINRKAKRIVMWRTISIAASIVIALTIGGVLIIHSSNQEPNKIIAQAYKSKPVITPARPLTPDTIKHTTIQPKVAADQLASNKRANINKISAANTIAESRNNPNIVANSGSNADISVDEPSENVNAKVAENQLYKDTMHATQYATLKRKDITGSVTTVTAAELANTNPIPNKNAAAPLGLEGKVAGLQITPIDTKPVTGVVKDETGAVLPGAKVQVKGTHIFTQTNADGKFMLPAVADKAVLDITFVGYLPAEVKAKKTDSLVIAMQPSNQSLNEVVTVGYGTIKANPARPASGMDSYNDYLKNGALSPDGKTGTVRLSFIVNMDNSLSDFKIIKSVSAKTDSAAIQLVKTGPNWYRNTNNKPQKVKLKIKFTGK